MRMAGRLVLRPLHTSRWVVLPRCRIGRDEFFTSDNDHGVFEHLRLVNFLLAHSHLDGTFDRSRARRLSLCAFVLLERGRDGVGVGVG